MWLVCAIILPVLAICVAVESYILISDALEKKFSGVLALVLVVSVASLFSTREKMKRARREMSGIVFNRIMRLVTGLPFADTQCGFKLFRRDAARRVFPLQRLDGFSFEVEDLFVAHTLGIPIIEVPVRWNNVEGTKVGLMQGVASFLDLLRIRWNWLQGRYAD